MTSCYPPHLPGLRPLPFDNPRRPHLPQRASDPAHHVGNKPPVLPVLALDLAQLHRKLARRHRRWRLPQLG